MNVLTNDILLIEKAIALDQNAYKMLLNKYKNLVFTQCIKMVKNRDEAEELAQDTFIKAFKALNSFKNESKFSTWLCKIAYNTCLNHIKKNKIITEDIDNIIVDRNGAFADENNPYSILQNTSLKETINICLSKMIKEDAIVLELFYLQGCKIMEITEIMNLEESTIKVKLFRARSRLKQIMISEGLSDLLKD
jgi:RNA polymerase sigma factor (sigma-70 family)